jgi:hypothetical protein
MYGSSARIDSHQAVFCPNSVHLSYTLVMGGAYPYMDLNAKYEKRYYDVLLRFVTLTGAQAE